MEEQPWEERMSNIYRIATLALVAGGWLVADTLTLRNGRHVEGTFVGGDARQVRILGADGNLQTFPVTDLETIRFESAASSASSAAAPAASRSGVARASSAPAAVPRVTIPAGAVITVRMIDGIDSNAAAAGERFKASLDDPLMVGDQTVAQRGADVTVQLVRVQQSGRLTGRDEVSLELYDITVNGKQYAAASSYAEVKSDSRTARTGKVVGGGAALGAIIGGIAGGGRGAAIGAASGAGAGAAVQVLTKGQRVKIPAESRLDFTLKQPVVIE